MRVYHLIKGLGRGGAEMLLPEVIRATSRTEAAFRVGYFLPWKDALVPTLDGLGVPVVCYGGRNNIRILMQSARVARDVRRWRADLLHCHLPITGAVGRLVGAATGVPVVYTEHNLQERYHPATAALNRTTWGLLSRGVACSEDVRRSIHEHIGDRVQVTTVPNGVSLERFRPDPALRAAKRADLGIDPNAPVMGTVAVFGDQKRLREWLQVAAQVRRAIPAARFLVIGDGPLRPEIEAEAAALGLHDVVMPGLQDDVRPWLQAMDVYVMTSKFEGLPVALLEAMASGLAPVCTSVGGIGQVIEEGVSGFLLPADEWAELQHPIVRLLQDPALRAQVSAAARMRVAERFSVDTMAQALLGIYHEVLDA